MLWNAQAKPNLSNRQLIDRIMTAGKIGRWEHLRLTSALLSDDKITDDERYQINRIFDYLHTGRIKLMD